MQTQIKTINKLGRKQIADFLRTSHKKGDEIANTESCLDAWCQDAELQLSEGSGAEIEIRSFEAVSGRTETFRIYDDGIDCETVEIDD